MRAKASGAFRQGDNIRIVGNSTAGAWARDLELDINAESPGIAALWARARIAKLLDDERRGAPRDEMRAAVVETALAHHLVSKYTSLVAVDKTPARVAGEVLRREQVPNLMAHGQSASAIFGLPATATSAPLQRITGMLILLLAFSLLFASTLRRRVSHAPAR